MKLNTKPQFIPIIAAICVILGICIGSYFTNRFSGKPYGSTKNNVSYNTSNKLNALLHFINEQYVDSVDMNQLIEDALPQVLAELDPHSMYLPAEEQTAAIDELRGSFSGIGIQFTIQQDTIHVNNVIKGGPSEKVGLMAGDRIVRVDDSLFVGKKVNNNEAMKRLKGPKGSEVNIGVIRPGEKEEISFSIIRGDIPVSSIDAAYMITDKFGYMRVTKFGETTYAEMLIALAKLNQAKCEGLIIDLRGNGGGLMFAAVQMVNEFLPQGKLIVYTEGRCSPRENYESNGTGSSQQMPIIVLTDESSASASEIFAGAIQDNDRGTIIGRRTFGKGLVQQPVNFGDGSAIRLTIARYYTPSGRCIQKPYKKGDAEAYEYDIINRFEHGEFFSQDSIHQNESETFLTSMGRKVYGGGGIMPDYFVPHDTTGVTSYLSMALNRGLTIQFSFKYTDEHRAELSKFEDSDKLYNYLKNQQIIEQFVQFAESKGLKRRNILIQKSMSLLENNLYGNIIYNMMTMEPYLQFLNKRDKVVQKAIEVLEKGESFPKAPEEL